MSSGDPDKARFVRQTYSRPPIARSSEVPDEDDVERTFVSLYLALLLVSMRLRISVRPSARLCASVERREA